MTPDWMPPLPQHGFLNDEIMVYTRQQVVDYALAAVEAYKRSLRPVAKLVKVRNRFGYVEQFTCERLSLPDGCEVLSDVPLYRLDGGDDE